jgi:hypothetical protein
VHQWVVILASHKSEQHQLLHKDDRQSPQTGAIQKKYQNP